MELKHGRNGVGGIEISKIRHLGPKQCGFGAPKGFFFLNSRYNSKRCFGLYYRKKILRASLRGPMAKKMEKKKKRKKKPENAQGKAPSREW